MTEKKIEDTSVLHFGNIEELAQKKYLDYAMSVITSRALPDVRDGLKPVQRRILYAMHVLKSSSNGVYKKSARIVGDVIGKYHPHGDVSVYDAMVRLAQPFSMRVMLIDGQGNFGSVDGDSAASMRYCFSGDTRVMTEHGLIQIKDFPELVKSSGETINLDMAVNSLDKSEKAVKWLYSGVQDVLTLTTNKGYQTTCTPNEPLYVLDKNLNYIWKDVQELKEGDFISLHTKNDVLIPSNQSLGNKNSKFPQKMSVKLAKFLGYLLSDGSMRINGTTVEFGSSDLEIYEDYKKLVKKLFPEQEIKERVFPISKDKKINSTKEHFYACINSTEMVKFLTSIGVPPCYAKEKKIPEIIFRASHEEVSAFISAYYEGDGSFSQNSKSKTLALSSTSFELLTQMKQLLLNYFGIISNKIHTDRAYEENVSYRMHINSAEDIISFNTKIGFLSSKKIKAAQNCIGNEKNSLGFKRNYIPNLSQYLNKYFDNLNISAKYMHDESGHKFLKQDVFKDFSLSKFKNVKTSFKLKVYLSYWTDEAKTRFPSLFAKLNNIIQKDYYHDKLTQIEKNDEKIPVYDLTVKNTHAFVANGFIAHNTEARFHKFSESMFDDIHLNTVDMQDNYDGTETEPTVLPLFYPNLLINGVQGIAVGMASNIPPHNPLEVMQAVKYMVRCKQDGIDPTLEDLVSIIPAPDFPTKGIVHGTSTMREAWTTGRGKMKLRSRWKEEIVDGRSVIVIYEIPYQVNKERLKGKLKEISLPIVNKEHTNFGSSEVEGIYDVTDESDKTGTRLCIYLKHGYDAEIIFNKLLKITELETSISYNATVIVNGEPKVLGLQSILEEFIVHRDEVITRRTQTLYDKNLAREVILDALMKAVHPDNLDKVINIVRSNKEVKDAREQLMTLLDINEIQGNAVLELSLKRLTGLEIDSMRIELDEKRLQNIEFRKILEDQQRRYEIIQEEADTQIKVFSTTKEEIDKYWVHLPYEKRLTEIHEALIKTDLGSLTKEEDSVLLYTHDGFIRRCPVEDFKEQRRGTQGNKKFDLHKNDYIVNTIDAHSHDSIMFITEKGQAFTINAYEVGTNLAGRHINNLLSSKKEDDKIAKIIPINFDANSELTLITEQGMVKRGKVQDYKTASVYKAGIRIMKIAPNDKIYEAHITTSNNDLMFFKSDNTVSRTDIENFNIKKGRVTTGVTGTKLTSKLVGVVSIDKSDEKGMVATITDNGLIKLSFVGEYRQTSRNSKGVKAFKESDRSGNLIKAAYIDDLANDIIIVTKKGIVNRIGLAKFRVSSRVSTGFKLIDLSKNDEIVSVFIVKSEEDFVEEPQLETVE